MELNTIISALEKAEIDAGVIDAVKGMVDASELDTLKRELDSEKGKNSGILDDKKKFKDRAEQAEKRLKELEDGKLTDEERTSKRLQELEEKLQQAEAAKQEQESAFATERRNASISDIASSIKWADGVPPETAKLIVRQSLADVDDLSDSSKVESVMKEIIENHKSFISADAPIGAGGKSGATGGTSGEDRPATMKELMSEVWQSK